MKAATANELSRSARIADILLIAALRQQARHLVVEPASDGHHRVLLHRHGRPIASAFLPQPLGATVIERYRFLADLAPTNGKPQGATWQVTTGDGHARLFLSTQGNDDGARAELWLLDTIVEPEAEPSPVMGYTPIGAGSVIGPLRLIAPLGTGGMGVVYRAHHERLDRHCAVKILRPEISLQAGSMDAFFREARLAARTESDRSINVMDAGTLPDGRPYIVMELVEGESLEELLVRCGPLEPANAAYLVRETALALAGLHARGVVHCDITISNVFVTSDSPRPKVKIVDFGSARVHAEQEDSVDTVCGTPYYMAPEQIRGERCDARTDLYSLGACLYELLSGAPPFEGDSAIEIARRHLRDPLVTPLSPHGDIPSELLAVLFRLLAKSPDERFQSASELAAALEPLMQVNGRKTQKLWLSAIA